MKIGQARRVRTNQIGIAGEFYVAAELSRRGFEVGLSLGNTKDIDLFVGNQSKAVFLQVKTTTKKNREWTLRREAIRSKIIYVFVSLNEIKTPPEFYICTAEEVKVLLKPAGYVKIYRKQVGEYSDKWDKIDNALNV